MKRNNILALFFLIASAFPLGASAATLTLSPASATVPVGQTATFSVRLSSTDQAANAVSGTVLIPAGLSVVSVSKTNSIINFWTTDPAVSSGIITFEGVVLNPGYIGPGGTVMTFTVRGVQEGTQNASFSSGSVLANDGQGTEILTKTVGATVSVAAKAETQQSEAVPTVQSSDVPTAGGIQINSSTHPDQSKWYDNDSPRFYWTLPSNAREARLLLDSNAKSAPTKSYTPAISTRTVDNLADGTYYFHLQVRTDEGWSAVSHFKVNIDTTQPRSFAVAFPHGSSSIEPQPVILFNTDDDVSGIEYYEVKVGNGGPLKTTAVAAKSNPYALPLQEPGSYIVSVTAYDKAGNTTTAESNFTVEGIDPPTVTSYPKELTIGDLLKVRGTTYADAIVELSIYDDSGELITVESTKSNSLNDFGITLTKRLGAGKYTFTVRAIDDRGARSAPTDPITFEVSLHLIADILAFVANYFAIVIIFVLAISGIALLGLWSFHKFIALSVTLKKERKEAETTIKKAFKLLKEDLEDHISRLHRASTNRTLTAEELAFLEQFGKDLRDAEDAIKDEFDDIPKA